MRIMLYLLQVQTVARGAPQFRRPVEPTGGAFGGLG
jgi:hypothetical protein